MNKNISLCDFSEIRLSVWDGGNNIFREVVVKLQLGVIHCVSWREGDMIYDSQLNAHEQTKLYVVMDMFIDPKTKVLWAAFSDGEPVYWVKRKYRDSGYKLYKDGKFYSYGSLSIEISEDGCGSDLCVLVDSNEVLVGPLGIVKKHIREWIDAIQQTRRFFLGSSKDVFLKVISLIITLLIFSQFLCVMDNLVDTGSCQQKLCDYCDYTILSLIDINIK